MYLQPYLKIEEKLNANVTGIKFIEWFNDQYAGTIHTAPAVFVEFPTELRFSTLRGQFQTAPFTVRIHLASKIIPDQAKALDKTLIALHDEMTRDIYFALQGFGASYDTGNKMFESLGRTALQQIQEMQGWLVITQDFESRIYQQQEVRPTHTVDDMAITVENE